MVIEPSAIMPDTPLRLATAAKLAFPDGSITAKSLRGEAKRGRLRITRIAGKDFTTLAAIKRMIEECHVPQSRPASTFANAPAANPSTSSSTVDARSALAAAQNAREKLKKLSPATSPTNTPPNGATVIPLASPSRMC